MNILQYEVRDDGYVVITTDDVDLEECVYPIDKFKNLKELKQEINKKLKEVKFRKQKKASRITQLEADFIAEGVPNARK